MSFLELTFELLSVRVWLTVDLSSVANVNAMLFINRANNYCLSKTMTRGELKALKKSWRLSGTVKPVVITNYTGT